MKYSPAIIITLCILFAYGNLPNTFFQQDEWQTLAANIYYLSKGSAGIIQSFLPTDPLSHFSPLARVFSWFEYAAYKTDFTLYAWQSIILHITNALLLYYFVYSWLKNKGIALICGLFFGVNSIPHQAVTWVAAANSYEVPTAFILLSLIFFHRFLEKKKHAVINLVLSQTMLFISLLFHEMGIFLFVFYPIAALLQKKPGPELLFRKLFTGVTVTILLFISIRIPLFFIPTSVIPEATDISRSPLIVYPYRLVSLGLKSFAGSFFPEKTLIALSDRVVQVAYPQFVTSDGVANPFIAQSIIFDLVSYILTVLIICLVIWSLRFIHDKTLQTAVMWSLLFVPVSVLPYALVLGKAGYASIFEPKFMYIPSIGISVLVGILAYRILTASSRSKLLVVFAWIFLGSYLVFHIYQIRSRINDLAVIGTQRKTFLETITSSYPDIPQKAVFFTPSNTVYYGMPDNEKILPVQIGFGKMLMVWYHDTEQFPVCMYEENFLLNMLDEGYKECDGRGYGYFRNYDTLLAAMKSYRIPVDGIIAFSWDGVSHKFTDSTDETHSKLRKDMQ